MHGPKMSWEKAEEEARKWAQDSGVGFIVTATDKEARIINFRAPCGAFYVTVPEKTGEEEWVLRLTHPRSNVLKAYVYLCADGVE